MKANRKSRSPRRSIKSPVRQRGARGAVTPNRAAREHAIAPEPRIASILERVSDGFVAFDAQMNYTYVNARGAELLGRQPADLIGKNYWQEYPEAKGTPFANAYARALETQQPIFFEDYYAPSERWFENRIYPSKDGLSIFFTEITERRRAEQAARESAEKLKDVFESANVGKSIASPDGKISVNKAFADMLGYSREELANKTWQELTPPDEIEAIKKILAPLLNGEKDSVRFNKRYIHKNGSFIWTDVSAVMRRGEDGKPLHFITTIVDINELKRTTEAYESIVENTLQGLAIFQDGRIKFANQAMARIFGMTREELTALSTEQLFARVHPEDLPNVREKVQMRLAGKDISPISESRFLRADGGEIWLQTLVAPIQYQGRPAFQNAILDITERKRAEEQLRLLEERFSNAFHTSPAGLSVTRISDGKFVEVNEAFLDLYEFSRAEVIGRTSTELNIISPETRAAMIRMQLETGGLRNAELLSQSKSGKPIHLLFSSAPIEMDGESCFITTMVDITEQKQAEEQLRLSEERFSNAFYTSPAGMTITRITDGKFVDANDAFCKMFDFNREEVIGHTSTELNMWTPEERKKLIDEQIRSGGLENFELRSRAKSGRFVNVLFSSKPMELLGEAHHVTTIIDITGRKQAEEALVESERRFREVLENVNLVAVLLDVQGRVTFCNQFLLNLTGYTNEEVLGRDWFAQFVPETRLEVRETFLQGLQRGEIAAHYENPIRAKDGSERFIRFSNTLLHDARGKIIGTTSIGEDITERKRAEDALRESEEKFWLFGNWWGIGEATRANFDGSCSVYVKFALLPH